MNIKSKKWMEERIRLITEITERKDCLVADVDDFLKEQGYDVDRIREDDVGGLVDALDYGRGFNIKLFIAECEGYKDRDKELEIVRDTVGKILKEWRKDKENEN